MSLTTATIYVISETNLVECFKVTLVAMYVDFPYRLKLLKLASVSKSSSSEDSNIEIKNRVLLIDLLTINMHCTLVRLKMERRRCLHCSTVDSKKPMRIFSVALQPLTC